MSASTEAYLPTGKEVPFGGGRFLLNHRLGNGSFGDIFEGYDKLSHRIVAVKLERKKARYPQLSYESKVYRVLHQPPVVHDDAHPRSSLLDSTNTAESSHTTPTILHPIGGSSHENGVCTTYTHQPPPARPNIVVGIPQIYYFDSEGDYNIMVMEMCGPSLEDVFNYCHRRFSLKTVLMLADQLLHRIQYFHEKGFVHRDIKPENFVLGCRAKGHILYIIDYGLSKLYWEMKKNSHIPFSEGRPLTGTARYCSANVHRGYEQSRRDDLESIGFLFVYFLQGSLPWQGIHAKDQQLKTIKIGEKKISLPLEDLCKGMPKEFLEYCQYCRALSFTQKPDYEYLRQLFRGLGKRLGIMLPSFIDPSDAMRGAPEPSNPLSSTPYMPVVDNSIVASQRLSAMSMETGSKASHPDRSPRTVAAQLVGQSEEVDPLLGPYDWEFDWICKRQVEVREGMDEQRRKQRLQVQQSSLSVRPPIGTKMTELKVEDVSDSGAFSPVEKVSEAGSKRPLFRGPVTETSTNILVSVSR